MNYAIVKQSRICPENEGALSDYISVDSNGLVHITQNQNMIPKIKNGMPFQLFGKEDIILEGSDAFNNILKYKMSEDVRSAILSALRFEGCESMLDAVGYNASVHPTWQALKDIFSDNNTYVYPYIFPMMSDYTGRVSSNGPNVQYGCMVYDSKNAIFNNFGYDSSYKSYNDYSRLNMAQKSIVKQTDGLVMDNLAAQNVNVRSDVVAGYSTANIGSPVLQTAENEYYKIRTPKRYTLFTYKDMIDDIVIMPRMAVVNDMRFYDGFGRTVSSPTFMKYDFLHELQGNGTAVNKDVVKSYHVPLSIAIKSNMKNYNYSQNDIRPNFGFQYGKVKSSWWGFDRNTSDVAKMYFIVRTKIPVWDQQSGTYEIMSNPGEDEYQYWFFSVNSLFSKTGSFSYDSTSPHFSSSPSGIDAYDFNGASQNSASRFLAKSSGVMSAGGTTINDYVENTITESYLAPPFSFFISKLSRYFNQSDTITVTSSSSQYARNVGLSILCNKSDFMKFLKDGLGLPATANENEFNYKKTSEWLDPPNPAPGSGGQFGGGFGGGTGIGGTIEGDVSDNVPNGVDSTGGARLNNAYAMTYNNVKAFQEALNDGSLWTAISNIFKDNPTEGLISLNNFPFNFEHIMNINDAQIKVLGDDVSDVMGTIIPTSAKTRIEMGSFEFKERFGSFLDYDPFNKITIYLPFCGFRRINANDVMQKKTKLQLDIDFVDGSCLYMLKVEQNENNYVTIYTWDGQIGTSVDIVSSDARENTQKKIKAALATVGTVAAGVATGGASVAASAAVGSAAANVASNAIDNVLDKPNYSANCSAQSQHAFAIGTKPYIIFEYPELNVPASQGQIQGYQVNTFKKIEEVSGFTQFADVKLDGIECTESEAKEIKNLLEGGIKIQ